MSLLIFTGMQHGVPQEKTETISHNSEFADIEEFCQLSDRRGRSNNTIISSYADAWEQVQAPHREAP